MSFRVELTAPAAAQAEAAAAWWRANRPSAPELFESELAAALELLSDHPLLTQVFDEIEGVLVRKVRLPRTRYGLYFTVGDDLVTVHAVWHSARGTGPPLL